jgi:uncharacterized membrane protein YccF (DUF307 family)
VKRITGELQLIIRIIWFFVLGWELTAIWILVAWAFNATIIGLPLGLWMIDRVPLVLTLRSKPGLWEVDLTNGKLRFVSVSQVSWLLRLPYFLLISWWLSLLWAATAWLICTTIIGLPIGVLMLNALPAVTTLHKE